MTSSPPVTGRPLGLDRGRRSSATGIARPSCLLVLLADEETRVLGDVSRLFIGSGVLLELAPVAQLVRALPFGVGSWG